MASVTATVWKGRPAVELKNGRIAIIVVSGGGHVVSMRALNLPEGVEDVNPLWEPPWPTTDPALRKLACHDGMEPGSLEGELLCGISGWNLCCDVFGEHSSGEVASGLAFHGEAGMVSWEVESVDKPACSVTLMAHLRRTMLACTRTFSLQGATLHMTEKIKNLCSFERVLGRAQHITIGDKFLLGQNTKCSFRTNCDRGMTWPTEEDADGKACSQWKPATEFLYPNMPRRDGTVESWCEYPRNEKSADLATLRVEPGREKGWFVVERARQSGAAEEQPTEPKRRRTTAARLALAVVWDRATFPWLMTWEENRSRSTAPWNSRTLTRGLEVSSYAFATSRRDNVERGKLFDTPCFEWLDADEEKSTTMHLSLQCIQEDGQTGPQLCGV